MNRQTFYDEIPIHVEHGGYNADKIRFLTTSVGANLRILDIGCNDGFLGAMFIKKHNEVYGIDIARRKVILAKKKGIKAIVADIEKELPYPRNFFDAVVLTDVIEHIFDTDALLQKIRTVLKPGGRLYITTPNVASLGRRIMLLIGLNPFLEYSTHYIDFVPCPVGHIRYYTHGDLRRQLERNRFREVVTRGDAVNLMAFSSRFAATLFPSFSINIHCQCMK